MRDRADSGRVESTQTKHLDNGYRLAESANDSVNQKRARSAASKGKRAYVTRANLEAIEERISGRQRAILNDVGRLGVLTGGQLQGLHYSASEAAKRQARQDLGELVQWKVLERLSRRIGGVRAGSKAYCYSLGVAGQRLINPGSRRYRRPWTPKTSYLRHTLALSDLYVQLRGHEAQGHLNLVCFDGEPNCWRSFSGPGGSPVLLKPDAYALVHVGDFEDRYFIEIDCGTESGPRIIQKTRVYLRYMQSGKESDVFPYVLWVAPNERRAELLIESLSNLPHERWQLFSVAVADRAGQLIAGQTITNEEVK